MLTFSGADTIDNLISAIRALPRRTEFVDEAFCQQAKDIAVIRLEATRSLGFSHAHINLRAAFQAPLKSEQLEIHIQGRAA